MLFVWSSTLHVARTKKEKGRIMRPDIQSGSVESECSMGEFPARSRNTVSIHIPRSALVRVELKGFEPSTFRMRTELSPNWATAPYIEPYGSATDPPSTGFSKLQFRHRTAEATLEVAGPNSIQNEKCKTRISCHNLTKNWEKLKFTSFDKVRYFVYFLKE